MKFTVHREALKQALEVASLALKDSAPDPILTHYLIEVRDGGKAFLKADNRFLFCEARMDVEDCVEGKMTIPGSQLKELAKSVDDGPIQFEMLGDDTVLITAGQAKLVFSSLPPEDFIVPEDNLAGFTSSTYSVAYLTEALKYMKVFIGQDKDRLQYMVAELRNGHWMASDGVKIGMLERPGFEGNVIIQTKALNSVLAYLKYSTCDAVAVTSTDKFCWFNDGVNKVAFRRDDRSFSEEIEKVLGAVEPTEHLSVNRDVLEKVVSRLKIALEGGNTRMEFSITGDEEGTMRVKTVNGRGKESEESLAVRRTLVGSEKFDFALDWRPLLETLQSDLFSEGMMDMYYIHSKSVVKLVQEREGVEAVSLIALRPS